MAKQAAQVAQKWARNLAASTEDIKAGVQGVTVNPAQAAIAKQAVMLQKLTASVNNGKWAKGLGRVTLEGWKQNMIDKGVSRIAGGAQAAEGKFSAFMTQLLPVAEQVKAQVKGMPKITVEDSIARSAAAIRAFKAFGESRR